MATMLRDLVVQFKDTLPVVAALKCPVLKQRHWVRIHEAFVPGVEQFSLGKLMQFDALRHVDVLTTISTEAVQESVLEEMLEKIALAWKAAEFEMVPYKDTKFCIFGGIDDIVALLDDSLVGVNTILGSRFVRPHPWER